jgi:hypothetical protein
MLSSCCTVASQIELGHLQITDSTLALGDRLATPEPFLNMSVEVSNGAQKALPEASLELCGILGDEVIRRRGLPALG